MSARHSSVLTVSVALFVAWGPARSGISQETDYPTTALYPAAQVGLLLDGLRQSIQLARPDNLRFVLSMSYREDSSITLPSGVSGREEAIALLSNAVETARQHRTSKTRTSSSQFSEYPLHDFTLRLIGEGPEVDFTGERISVQFAARLVESNLAERGGVLVFEVSGERWYLTNSSGLMELLESATRQRFQAPATDGV